MEHKFFESLKKMMMNLVMMASALALTYYLGVEPFLIAQTQSKNQTGPADPDLPILEDLNAEAQSLGSVSAQTKANQKNEDKNLKNVQDSQKNALEVVNESIKSQNINLKNLKKVDSEGQLESSKKNKEASNKYKFTKSYVGDLSIPDRDPFRKPEYILENEDYANKPQQRASEVAQKISAQVEAIRRWPLSDYRLIAVLWDVQSPKALIMDPANVTHMLKKNFRIGDRNGVISEINEGSITVVQDNAKVVIGLAAKK